MVRLKHENYSEYAIQTLMRCTHLPRIFQVHSPVLLLSRHKPATSQVVWKKYTVIWWSSFPLLENLNSFFPEQTLLLINSWIIWHYALISNFRNISRHPMFTTFPVFETCFLRMKIPKSIHGDLSAETAPWKTLRFPTLKTPMIMIFLENFRQCKIWNDLRVNRGHWM